MEVKIGVQHVSRELSIETSDSPDAILKALNTALEKHAVFSLNDDKGQTVLVPAEKVAYLYFTDDSGRKVGFAK